MANASIESHPRRQCHILVLDKIIYFLNIGPVDYMHMHICSYFGQEDDLL